MQYLKNTLISTFVMICLFFFMGIGKIDKIKKTYIKDEVIVFVDMKVKRNVPLNKISNFTKRYQEFVDQTEINSLGWSYHKSGNKIVLIERYKNEDANIITAKNISPNGIRYNLLKEAENYFKIEKVSVFGAFTEKLIDFNLKTAEALEFDFDFEYYPIISGYSRNLN